MNLDAAKNKSRPFPSHQKKDEQLLNLVKTIFVKRKRGYKINEKEAVTKTLEYLYKHFTRAKLSENINKCKSSNFFKTDCIHSFIHVSVFTIVLQLMDIHSEPFFDLGSFVYSVGNKGGSDWGRRHLSSFEAIETLEMIKRANTPSGNEVTGFDSRICNSTEDIAACLRAVENICDESDFCYRGLKTALSDKESEVIKGTNY